MNKQYDALHNMLSRLRDFFNKYQVELEANTLVWEVVVLILAIIPKLENVHSERNRETLVTTAQKKRKKRELAVILGKVNQLFFNYFTKINKEELTLKYRTTDSQYLLFPGTGISVDAKNKIEDCENMGEALSETGITPEMLTELKIHAGDFSLFMSKPVEVRNLNKRLRREEVSFMSEINSLIVNRLNKLMKTFFKSLNPPLYEAYLDASHKENPISRKLALKGRVFCKETGEVITGVHVLIPELGIDHICRGSKGYYQILNIEPGTYKIRVVAINFQIIESTLVHNQGETTIMNFELESLPQAAEVE